jgi:hypothetical protein
MQELISPSQSEAGVLIASLALTFLCALRGWRVLGSRGAVAGVLGPLVFGLWKFHQWMTRFDLQTEYFGLDKVKVLLLEVVVFVVVGVVLGLAWKNLISRKDIKTQDA